MKPVLLSYARTDRAYAAALAAHLEFAGIEVGRDLRGEAGVDKCRLVVLLLTPGACASPRVARELRHADALGTPILPLLLDDGAVPPPLVADLHHEDVRGGALPGPGFLHRIHQATGRHARTLAAHHRAIKLDPRDARALAARGEMYRLMECYDEAVSDFDRVLTIEPGNTAALANRAETYRLMGRYDEAAADFGRLIDQDPDDDWARAGRGEALQESQRYDEALADYDRVLTRDPGNVRILTRRGLTHRLLGHYEEALADYDRSLELAPTSHRTLACRGDVHVVLERYDAALADFDRAIALVPDHPSLFACRGEVYRLMERYDEALSDFDRAVELDPDDAWTPAQRRLTRRDAEARADLDSAARWIPTVIHRSPATLDDGGADGLGSRA